MQRTSQAPYPALRRAILGLIALSLVALVAPGIAAGQDVAAAQEVVAGAHAAESEERAVAIGQAVDRDDWYRITLDGQDAGTLHVEERREGDDLIFELETRMRFRRGDIEVALETAGRFVEGPAGEPRSMWSKLVMAEQPIETFYRFSPDQIEVTTVQGDLRKVETRPRPEGEWLSPLAADRLAQRYEAEGAERYQLVTLDPTQGARPVEITRELVARGLPSDSGAGPGAGSGTGSAEQTITRWRETQSTMPGIVATVDLAPDGGLVRSRTNLMGMSMEIVKVDRADLEGPETAAPEIIVSSVIRPNQALPEPRQRQRVVYRLYPLEGTSSELVEIPLPPTAGAQRSERRSDDVLVTVEIEPENTLRPQAEASEPTSTYEGDGVDPAEEGEDGARQVERYLRASPFLDHEVEAVRRLLEVARSGAGDLSNESAHQRAERLRRFVYGYLDQKDLGTGFASAAEVAESRAGDCTEHSVLLAALLRAEAIPSRVVAGLVYVDEFLGEQGIFGYHMWVQARIDGRWLDLDPSFPDPFDAGHIALGTSALEDSTLNSTGLETLAALFGSLAIDIVETDS